MLLSARRNQGASEGVWRKSEFGEVTKAGGEMSLYLVASEAVRGERKLDSSTCSLSSSAGIPLDGPLERRLLAPLEECACGLTDSSANRRSRCMSLRCESPLALLHQLGFFV